MDPAVKKETGFIALWTGLLSLILEAVFLVIRKWDLSVLLGNLGGAAAAIGKFLVYDKLQTVAAAQREAEQVREQVELYKQKIAVMVFRFHTVSVYCEYAVGFCYFGR